MAKATVKKIGRKRRAAGWTLLTLGVLVAGVWGWSGWSMIEVYCGAMVRASRGTLDVIVLKEHGYGFGADAWIEDGTPFFNWGLPPTPDSPDRYDQLVSVGLARYTSHKAVGHDFEAVLWPMPLLLWTPAALLLRSGIIARRRAMTGKCKACGYDLAGLGADAPCPECGKAETKA